MVPEFTCGKLILPFRRQFISFSDLLRVNSGKLMLPSAAILWVKSQLGSDGREWEMHRFRNKQQHYTDPFSMW